MQDDENDTLRDLEVEERNFCTTPAARIQKRWGDISLQYAPFHDLNVERPLVSPCVLAPPPPLSIQRACPPVILHPCIRRASPNDGLLLEYKNP